VAFAHIIIYGSTVFLMSTVPVWLTVPSPQLRIIIRIAFLFYFLYVRRSDSEHVLFIAFWKRHTKYSSVSFAVSDPRLLGPDQ